MSPRIASAWVVLLGLSLGLAGCFNRGPSRIEPPGIDAGAAGTAAMTRYDANSDGVVKGPELDKAPALKAALKNLDTDGDQGVSAAEVTARINAWKESKVGRMAPLCTVTRGGKPLADATVKFVPETFLGSELPAAEGKTDASGLAMPTAAGADPPGCAPGLYRVEITKADGSIPPEYNTETTLGQEIALDAQGMQEGIKFELK